MCVHAHIPIVCGLYSAGASSEGC